MGTRRSKHNRGRKPLYKEHRENLVDAPSVFGRAEFDEELPRYDPDPEVVAPGRVKTKPKAVNVELVAEVEAFLARRSAPHPELVALHEIFNGLCFYCGTKKFL